MCLRATRGGSKGTSISTEPLKATGVLSLTRSPLISRTDVSCSPLTVVPAPAFLVWPKNANGFEISDLYPWGPADMEPSRPRPPGLPAAPRRLSRRSLSVSTSSLAYHVRVLFICFFVLNKIWPHCVGATPEKKNKIHPRREKRSLWELGGIYILRLFHFLVMSESWNTPLKNIAHSKKCRAHQLCLSSGLSLKGEM